MRRAVSSGSCFTYTLRSPCRIPSGSGGIFAVEAEMGSVGPDPSSAGMTDDKAGVVLGVWVASTTQGKFSDLETGFTVDGVEGDVRGPGCKAGACGVWLVLRICFDFAEPFRIFCVVSTPSSRADAGRDFTLGAGPLPIDFV